MKNYRLAIDGDGYEQHYWSLFIQNNFQSYEDFWIENIVPLTNRPTDIHFKTDQELIQIGKTANDICIAQLHYSILRHLARAFDIFRKDNFDLDDLTDGMTRLCGSIDVAFELLMRHKEPGKYGPWRSIGDRENEKLGSKEAREDWENELESKNEFPKNIKIIRHYRNHLVHGRMMPGIIGNLFYFPKTGKEKKYFDWRKVTRTEIEKNIDDFMPAKEILKLAWSDVIDYFDTQWRIHLLKQYVPDKGIEKSHHIPEIGASGVWSTGVKSYDTSAVQLSASIYEIEKE